jgi:dUTP pyrophosphatase
VVKKIESNYIYYFKKPRQNINMDTNMHTTQVGFTSTLEVKRCHPDAMLPTRQTEGSAGYDLHCVEDAVIPARGQVLMSTGIAIKLPYGTYGRIAPRSGMSVKGTMVGAGVIDFDFRGHIKVLMFNMTDVDITIQKQDRIAQLIIERIDLPLVKEVDSLDRTQRGGGGFGSTGL